jgi:hypothetical protein
MPLDPSIPLGTKVPDPMQSLSGLLNVGNNILTYKRNLATFDSDVAQRQAESSSAQSNATVNAANVNPLIEQQAAQTSTAQTGAKAAQFGLQKDYMGTALQTASGLAADPRLAAGPKYSDEAAANAIAEAENQMVAKGVPIAQAKMATAPLYMQVHTPGAVQQMLKNTITGNMAPASQGGAISPNTSFVSTSGGTQPFNTNALSGPVGPTGSPMAPPNQFVSTPTGRMGVGNTASGTVTEPQAGGAQQPPVNPPPGETQETLSVLQGQRMSAQQAALGAPQMHDINRTILAEADTGLNTGTLGALTQKLASATGFTIAPGSSTDYNLLGKMLERSAATAAQSMGPHTNAGLESAIRQNGSLEYTPQAIKTIARLNDSLTTGAEKYHQGLEAAISSSPNNVFAKRQFDQQWSQNADVNALKLLTASKNGDKEGVQEVLKAVGGPGSSGAKKLAQQLQNLQSLTVKGSL